MVLQKLTKSYKSELRHLFQFCILIPRKCPRKTPFQHTVPLHENHNLFRKNCKESYAYPMTGFMLNVEFMLRLGVVENNFRLHSWEKLGD